MVTVGEFHSDVVVEPGRRRDGAEKTLEMRIEEIRPAVRRLIEEELERLVRTEVRG